MKMKKWKRVFSGILAAVTVLSTCIPGSVMASSEETADGYPTLEEIIDQLDEDEIVRPGDYTVPVGSDLDISLDFTNFNVTDWMKVNIYFDGAYNEEGEYFFTDHADTYEAHYHVEPVSGHPVYQVSRNVRVKEVEKPKNSTAGNTGKTSAGTSPNNSAASGGGDGGKVNSASDRDGGGEDSDDDSHKQVNRADTADPSGGDAAADLTGNPGGDTATSHSDNSASNASANQPEHSTGDVEPNVTEGSDTENIPKSSEGSDAGAIPKPSDDSDGDSIPAKADSSGGDAVTKPSDGSEKKNSPANSNQSPKAGDSSDSSVPDSSIFDSIISFLTSDGEPDLEEETVEEEMVGAGPRINDTVDCISGSFGSVYVNHVYQTVGNPNGDVIVYCGEIDMHFEAGAHSRVNLVGASLQGTVITAEEALSVGIMQHYFFYVSGVSTDQARGLT